MDAYLQSVQDVLKDLASSQKGLTQEEAEQRLARYGFNELAGKEKIHPGMIFVRQFKSPLIWILLTAMGISVFLNQTFDVVVIGIIVIFNAILGFVQEFKAERSIEALRKLAAPQARVIRNKKELRMETKYLVPGDIIVLETGEKVPADARLITCFNLETQEASLTGESQPVAKKGEALTKSSGLADRQNMIYSSTIITQGHATAVVTATGANTQIGRIATLIKGVAVESTPLQKKMKTLGKNVTLAVVVVAIIVFLLGAFTGKDWTTMFLVAVALAVAAIPEGLPAVITISLALGVQRMAKKNTLVRTLPAVEALGSVTVICTDKTGTLTENEMTVRKIWANEKVYDVSGSGYSDEGEFSLGNNAVKKDELKTLLTIGLVCNNAKISRQEGKVDVIGDPTEAALLIAAEKGGLTTQHVEARIDEISFASERKMMTTIHKTVKGTISYTKGAPEVILQRCTRILIQGKVQRLEQAQKKEILKQSSLFAKKALRVLAFAYNINVKRKEDNEKDMIFVGLQAMMDPPRLGVKESIQRCHDAGIRVIMITGDHVQTAQAIAQELGIPGEVMSGAELEKQVHLEKIIDKVGVFARVNPEDKLKIVQALQRKGQIVAMTGDGVNDAPALKKADLGIAMGMTGTDVAKEASDLILTDDHFSSIVKAVEEGRGIFDNIRKFINYLFSSNLGEIVLIFLATLLALPLPLTAIHILWINLITDGLPAIALSLDPPQEGIMKQKPRKTEENIISKKLAFNIVFLGLMIGITTLLLFWLYRDATLIKAQTIAFTALVIFEIVRLHMIRTDYKLGLFSNKFLLAAVGLSLLLQLIVLYTPLQNIFKVVALDILDWFWIVASVTVLLIVNKIIHHVKKVTFT